MMINTVSLVTGALSFSAAMAWNTAIYESLKKVTGPSGREPYLTIMRALIVTAIIIAIILIVNTCAKMYEKVKGIALPDHVIEHGNHPNSKVHLWLGHD